MKTENISRGINWVSANNIFSYKRKMVYELTNVYNLNSYNTLIYSVGMNKYRKWGKESTKKELNKIKKKLGHSPKEREISYKLYKACQRHFGTFNNAKKFAKLELTLPSSQHQLQKQYKILNPNLGYILGVAVGDACVDKRSRVIRLIAKDKDFVLKFKNNLKIWCELRPTFKFYRGYWLTSIHSIELVNFIKAFDLSRIQKASPIVKASFLKGFFDSEGSVIYSPLSKNYKGHKIKSGYLREIVATNTNKNLMILINSMLLSLKIKNVLRIRKGNNVNPKGVYYSTFIMGKENLIKFKKLINFSIERKQNKLNFMVNNYERK